MVKRLDTLRRYVLVEINHFVPANFRYEYLKSEVP